jgi:hypothetical protein
MTRSRVMNQWLACLFAAHCPLRRLAALGGQRAAVHVMATISRATYRSPCLNRQTVQRWPGGGLERPALARDPWAQPFEGLYLGRFGWLRKR